MIQASPRRSARPAWPTRAMLAALLLLPGSASWAESPFGPPPAFGGVVGLREAYLDPAFWAARLPDPDRVILDSAGIAAQNARMRAEDKAIHDLRALPARLGRARVLADIQALSRWPEKPLFGEDGHPVPGAARTAIEANLALPSIPAERPLHYGLVTHRVAGEQRRRAVAVRHQRALFGVD